MDIEALIEQLKVRGLTNGSSLGWHSGVLEQAADVLAELQAENEKLRAEAEGMRSNWYKAVEEVKNLQAELEQVKRERGAAKSPEVLEAVDELMEFARTRMGIAEWLYYVDVLGEWRGPKED